MMCGLLTYNEFHNALEKIENTKSKIEKMAKRLNFVLAHVRAC